MSLQNRVMPDGEILACAARGTLMGNRGILHDANRQLGTARWKHRNWVCCRLSFKNRRRDVMQPGAYTELFFLDEAVALAAGHRPCAECRRADYTAYRAAWAQAFGSRLSAVEMDRVLHAARINVGTKAHATHEAEIATLPQGTFILHSGKSALVMDDRLLRFAPAGYDLSVTRPGHGRVMVLTPKPSVGVIAAGYRPQLHHSSGQLRAVSPPS